MATLRRELDKAETDHAYRIKKLEDRICALYKAGGRDDELLELLIGANGIKTSSTASGWPALWPTKTGASSRTSWQVLTG